MHDMTNRNCPEDPHVHAKYEKESLRARVSWMIYIQQLFRSFLFALGRSGADASFRDKLSREKKAGAGEAQATAVDYCAISDKPSLSAASRGAIGSESRAYRCWEGPFIQARPSVGCMLCSTLCCKRFRGVFVCV